ncbi:hypothetical protein PHYPO_G00186170 [Pangasianodon hypophthalmus]|uniref:Uncharacterized protein n=1 Tax=Pangasianodon hypophthalmus TaxID=310915 RepID=A0A5N5JI25_PANHP|nr:hypothetical protein PHYPO_G00186170 [Pangasianodon hypophthalmus]
MREEKTKEKGMRKRRRRDRKKVERRTRPFLLIRARNQRMRSRMARRMMPKWSLLRERSTRQMGRPGRKTFKATQQWSWQEPRSERDQAKEEHGTGSADASQAEGHDSTLMARMSSQRQRQKQTQSFKRKPGRADNERSLGDTSERVHKRLRYSGERRAERAGTHSQRCPAGVRHVRAHQTRGGEVRHADIRHSERRAAETNFYEAR